MKLILLMIKGFYSFREEQIIDFDGLFGVGVFGIFGLMGSGKLLIFDVMIFVLYGKVECVVNNMYGILNYVEDQFVVFFIFVF